jgi:hypothetical protein
MVRNLNALFACTKIKPAKFRKLDVNQLRKNPITESDDWSKSEFSSVKRFIRYTHYHSQKRRCVYCRRKLNPLGINEHLDHVVARSYSHKWMFKPRNLVLSCYQCNTQKSAASSLILGRIFKRLPKQKSNYLLFNPYFHCWNDHFEVEDDIFLKAKSTEGQYTIDTLKLYDFKYSIVYADEANIFGMNAITRATTRLTTYPKGSVEFKSAKKLIQEIERHL